MFDFLFGHIGRTCRRRGALSAGLSAGKGCAISGVDDGVDNRLARKDRFVVIDLHAVGQQIDAGLFYALQLGDGFFDAGRAGRAGHARYLVCFMLHAITPLLHQFLQGTDELVDDVVLPLADWPRSSLLKEFRADWMAVTCIRISMQ